MLINTAPNYYYQSLERASNVPLVVMATSIDHVHVDSVVLVLPVRIHLLNVVFFVLVLTDGMIAVSQSMIDAKGNLVDLYCGAFA